MSLPYPFAQTNVASYGLAAFARGRGGDRQPAASLPPSGGGRDASPSGGCIEGRSSTGAPETVTLRDRCQTDRRVAWLAALATKARFSALIARASRRGRPRCPGVEPRRQPSGAGVR